MSHHNPNLDTESKVIVHALTFLADTLAECRRLRLKHDVKLEHQARKLAQVYRNYIEAETTHEQA